jgi:glycerate-2-kinase
MRIGVEQPRVRAVLQRLFQSALNAVDPFEAVHRHVRRTGHRLRAGDTRYDLRHYRRIVAVGAGKASARMAAALEDILASRLDGGLVVVKYGHGAPTRQIEIAEAAHPIPDQAGLRAAERLLAAVGELSSRDLAFVLLSGGASSLLPAPVSGLTLSDKQRTTALLLRSGATIRELNTVRKHLSSLKGGNLAAATRATVITLILSDVVGDDIGTIASGPTAPDPTTSAEACDILRRYRIWKSVPRRVQMHLLLGVRGIRPESPKPDAPVFRRVRHVIIGNNRAAVDAAVREAARSRLRPLVLSTSLTGEAREAARIFGAIAREIIHSDRPIRRPACIVAGGELTVSVRGSGRGGRAQEFALAAAREIQDLPNVYVVGFGTDGSDGPTDAAGAVAHSGTLLQARRLGVNPDLALERNDAYPFFKKVGGLIVTGPTGTNVGDLYFLLVL